jgi:hypothetical protein
LAGDSRTVEAIARDWRTNHALKAVGLDQVVGIDHYHGDDDTVLVVGHWLYAGRGNFPGQAVYTKTIANDIAENRRIWRQIRHDDEWEIAL